MQQTNVKEFILPWFSKYFKVYEPKQIFELSMALQTCA